MSSQTLFVLVYIGGALAVFASVIAVIIAYSKKADGKRAKEAQRIVAQAEAFMNKAAEVCRAPRTINKDSLERFDRTSHVLTNLNEIDYELWRWANGILGALPEEVKKKVSDAHWKVKDSYRRVFELLLFLETGITHFLPNG